MAVELKIKAAAVTVFIFEVNPAMDRSFFVVACAAKRTKVLVSEGLVLRSKITCMNLMHVYLT